MAMPKLSARLSAITRVVLRGPPVWDIGCDHGLVGLNSLATGRASAAVFVDRSPRVIERLRQTATAHLDPALQARTRIIAADAAELPPEPLHGTVVIAGMGSRAIVRILERFVAPNACDDDALRLVLQPEVETARLEGWLSRSNWPARAVTLEERGRSHALFVADRI